MWALRKTDAGWEALRAGERIGDLHATRWQAMAALGAEVRAALQMMDGVEGMPAPGKRFEAVFTEGQGTRDGGGLTRVIDPDATQFDRFEAVGSIPWMLSTETTWGHEGAELAGVVDGLKRDGTTVILSGRFDSGCDAGEEAQRLVEEGILTTWSPDFGEEECTEEVTATQTIQEGDYTIEVPSEITMHFVKATLMGGTQVTMPALDSAVVSIVEEPAAAASATSVGALVAGACGAPDWPIDEDRERVFQEAEVEPRVRAWASSDGSGDKDKMDWTKYRSVHFWYDPDNAEAFGGYKMKFCDIVDGKVHAVARGVYRAANALQGGRGTGVDIPSGDVDAVKAKVAAYYERLAEQFKDDTIVAPWLTASAAPCDECDEPAETPAGGNIREPVPLVASPAPVAPPAAWFTDPGFTGPTPLTIDDDGRVRGHLAAWSVCHTGFGDRCVLAPHSQSDYAFFTTGAVRTREGSTVRVGQLTMGCGHAGLDAGSGTAKAHYDGGPGAVQWADVAVGEDAYGIWIAGAVRPGLSEAQMREARAQALSGDWRDQNGALELIAALSVPVPGFPVVGLAASAAPVNARSRSIDGKVLALVAAGMVRPIDPLVALESRMQARIDEAEARLLTALESRTVGLVPVQAAALRERIVPSNGAKA